MLAIQEGGGSEVLGLATSMKSSSQEGYTWMWMTASLSGDRALFRQGVIADKETEARILVPKYDESVTIRG